MQKEHSRLEALNQT